MTPRTDERDTGKPARILTAAESLILKRGFKGVTMTDVAGRAQVGKGTVYLYWKTKESLFLDIITRNIREVLDEVAGEVEGDPELALPGDLCLRLVRGVLGRPLVRALQTSDADVLGALIADPRSQEIVRERGAAALIRGLLPLWRAHGLARTDRPAERQAYALQILVFGFLESHSRELVFEDISASEKDLTLKDTVDALLGGGAPVLGGTESGSVRLQELASETITVLRG